MTETNNTVYNQVINYLKENLNLSDKELDKALKEKKRTKPESTLENLTLIKDLGADSLDLVQTVMDIEDKYNIRISEDDVKTLQTIGDIRKYIEKHT